MSRNSIIPQEPMAPISHPHFHQTYKYDSKLKEWQFMGFRCIRCGHVFKKHNTIDGHAESCKYIITTENMLKRDIENQPYMITPKGKLWQPLDFNQNLSVEK